MQGTPQARRMSIWLVEDNEDHALLCRRALRQVEPELGERLVVTTIADGAAARPARRRNRSPWPAWCRPRSTTCRG